VLLNNNIINVASLMKNHPGGNYLILNNIGKDIGRYFYGTCSYDTSFKSHPHSYYAMKLADKLTIGRLSSSSNNESILNTENLNETSVVFVNTRQWNTSYEDVETLALDTKMNGC